MEKEYTYLFNTITDVIKELEKLKLRLIESQQTAEELFISRENEKEK